MSTFVNILDILYPVGSIYQSMEPTSPSELIGGTWEQIKTFLMGSDTSKQTGGEATHTLTIQEMPSHTHGLYGAFTGKTETITNTGNNWAQTTTNWSNSTYVKETGGGQAHNNLPPYTTCYIWYRVA